MQLRSCVGLLVNSLFVAALDTPYATPTSQTVDQPGASSPKHPLPTKPPVFHRALKRGLVAQDNTLICGYINGDPSQPNICGPSSQCLFNTVTDALYFWCDLVGTTAYISITTCLTYDGSGTNTGPQYVTDDDGGTTGVTCGITYSLCRTSLFPSVPNLKYTGTYTHYDCVSNIGDAGPIITLSQDPVSSTAFITVAPPASQPPRTVATTIISYVTPSAANATPAPDGGLSTSAKAGIGVGVGLGAALAIAVAMYFWWRSKKRRRGVEGTTETFESRLSIEKKPMEENTQETNEKTKVAQEHDKNEISELGAGDEAKPAELDHTNVRVELEGDLGVSEAPTGR